MYLQMNCPRKVSVERINVLFEGCYEMNAGKEREITDENIKKYNKK